MQVKCVNCGNPYEIKRKTCKDGLLWCGTCKQKRRKERFITKYGTTPAKLYGPRYKARAKAWSLRHYYGMSRQEYDQLLENQNGVCAICRKAPVSKHLCVDHDHNTGKVRGLLCDKCNMTLGIVQDQARLLQSFYAYLTRNGPRPSWDQHFLDMARFIATRSKDRSTQVGAILVRDKMIISTGYNGFPRGIDDNIPARHQRPAKHTWVVHAEENAIFNCVRNGMSTEGSTIYVVPMHPCTKCARSIISAGIREVIYENINNPRWEQEAKIAREIFAEAGVISRSLTET